MFETYFFGSSRILEIENASRVNPLPLTPVGVISELLKTACIPVRTCFMRPEPMHHCQIQLGRQIAHSSHNIYIYIYTILKGSCIAISVETVAGKNPSSAQPRKVFANHAKLLLELRLLLRLELVRTPPAS